MFFVSLDVTRPGWSEHLEKPAAWLAHTSEPFHRPTVLLNRQRDGGRLVDGFAAPGGWPTVVCAHFQMAAGAGWEVVEGEERLALVTRAGPLGLEHGSEPHIELLPLADPRLPDSPPARCRFHGGDFGVAMLHETDQGIAFSAFRDEAE